MKKKILFVAVVLIVGIASFIGGTHVNTKNHLNLNTATGFDATETGLMLYTNDGNGYYLER